MEDLNSILVTGASGFIGRALCHSLLSKGRGVKAAVRNLELNIADAKLPVFPVGNIGLRTRWRDALSDVDCIIHCAAHVHIMKHGNSAALDTFRAVNLAGTQRLAEQAAASGVRRFVFLSTIKVNGSSTGRTRSFTAEDVPAPCDDYAISKYEAELALWEVAKNTGLQVVVVRPPLVLGPGVKGNLLRLLHWLHLGAPLPFGAVNNQRSFIGLSNLVALLLHCVDHPAAAGQTLLASETNDLSTPELICMIAHAMHQPTRLFPVPVELLCAAGSLFGIRSEVDRLVGSLRVDSSYTQELLNWSPTVSTQTAVRETVDWFLHNETL
jgi:nucleoside-diphosphate-sugar epimerase